MLTTRFSLRRILVVGISTLLLMCVLRPPSTSAYVEHIPGSSWETAVQLGLTNKPKVGEDDRGIMLPDDKNPSYFWFYLEKEQKVRFMTEGDHDVFAFTAPSAIRLYDNGQNPVPDGDSGGNGCWIVPLVINEYCADVEVELAPGAYYVVVNPPWGGTPEPNAVYSFKWSFDGSQSSRALLWTGKQMHGFMAYDQKEHWYRMPAMTAGQRAQLKLWGQPGSNLDLFLYDSSDLGTPISEVAGTYPAAASFTSRGGELYVRVVNAGNSDAEYTLSTLGACYDFYPYTNQNGVVYWDYEPDYGNCGSEQNHAWYLKDTKITVGTTPLDGFFFDHWEGTFGYIPGEQNNPYTFNITGDTELLAVHLPCASLSFTYEGKGEAPVATTAPNCMGDEKYLPNTKVTVEARPATGWGVAGWVGTLNDSSTELTNTAVAVGDKEVGVIYKPACYPLTLESTEGGRPPVPDHANSDGCPDGHYSWGDVIVLAAYPEDRWVVDSWDGAIPYPGDDGLFFAHVEMPPNPHTVTVNYRQVCFALMLKHEGEGSPPTPDIVFSDNCPDYNYGEGTRVRLTSHPAEGWHVARWEGTDNDATAARENAVTMPAHDHTVTIVYGEDEKVCHRLTLFKEGSGAEPVAKPSASQGCPMSTYVGGEPVILTAKPASGWEVGYWSGTSDDASTALTNSLTMPGEPHTAGVYYVLGSAPPPDQPTPSGTPPPDPAPPTSNLVVDEQFDSGSGFTQTSPNVYVAGGRAYWNVDRSGGDQFLYRSITSFDGDVRITVRGQVNHATNNCAARVGVGDSPGSGISVSYGFYGGGCDTYGYVINAQGVALSNQEYACEFTGNWLWIAPNTDYTAQLTVSGQDATLTVGGIGSTSGTRVYPGNFSVFWVGMRGLGDYPTCSGSFDWVTVDGGGTAQQTCVPPTIELFEAERAPSKANHDWQLVYRVRGATHVRVYDNTVADPSSGVFPIWLPKKDTNYLGWWTLTAYSGSEECFTQESRELWYKDLPPAGTYSGLLVGFTDVDVSQRNIIISLRDNALVDGDIVDLLINGVKVLSGYTLTGKWFDVPVQLKSGPNTVTVVALNEGSSSPNTVEIHISHVISGIPDQVSSGLLTGQSDTLVIKAP